MTSNDILPNEETCMSPLPTYRDQEMVRRAEEWRERFVEVAGRAAVAASFSDMYRQEVAHLQWSIETGIEEMTLIIGERVKDTLLSSPFMEQAEHMTGRCKSIPSLLAKRRRREKRGSQKPFSDICAYTIDLCDGGDPEQVLQYMRGAFGAEEKDAYGDPTIEVMGNPESDPTFHELHILVGKFHTAVGGVRQPFELMVRTPLQRIGYEQSRSVYEATRTVDEEIIPAIGLVALREPRQIVFYSKVASGS